MEAGFIRNKNYGKWIVTTNCKISKKLQKNFSSPGNYTSHKNNCRAKRRRAYLSESAWAIISGSCFCGDYDFLKLKFGQNRLNIVRALLNPSSPVV